tara:strand:+ start:84458 stop:85834 length:1377 start_codon:yes stop_codon:yes gene_type:complete
MKIIILGGNQVGGALAEQLVREGNDITVVDVHADRLRELESRLDIRTIVGHAAYPSILRKAGAEDADMLIAVTNSDEVNIVACQVAYTLFHVPTKIARLRAAQYNERTELFSNEHIPIDVTISPEEVITQHISRLIDYPGALQVIDFAEGKVRMISIKIKSGSPVVGRTLADININLIPEADIRVVAIYRLNHSIELDGDTIVERGDEVFFIAQKEFVDTVLDAFGLPTEPYKRIMIAGGGNIGFRLAQKLEALYQVKLLENEPDRAEFVAGELSNTTVLQADASDKDLLIDENIENVDVFCAVTNDDEANIMSCLQAKRLGAKQVMALITRTAYVDLIEGGGIDIAISPQQATIGSILRYIRAGDVANVYSLRRDAAEAIEVVAHGDEKTSKVVGRAVGDLKLPEGTNIGAIVRGDEVIIGHHDSIIEAGDHVLLFVLDKKRVKDIERLFQVSATFL